MGCGYLGCWGGAMCMDGVGKSKAGYGFLGVLYRLGNRFGVLR